MLPTNISWSAPGFSRRFSTAEEVSPLTDFFLEL